MVVTTNTSKIIDSLSYTEARVIRSIAEKLDTDQVKLVISTIADEARISRSIAVNALTKLSAAGVLETRSLGMKGMAIKVLNREAFDEIIRTISS